MNGDARLQKLKEILLRDEWEARDSIQSEISVLNDKLVAPEEVKKRVHPFIEAEIEYLRKNFPDLYGDIITATIKKQIEDSQDEMVEALYPIIGKLIRKFIVKEIEKLSERIDAQVNSAFSWEGWKNRAKAWFTGVKEEEMIIRDLIPTVIEEAFVIQKDSGLLLGSYTRNDIVDQDMIAGMLSAIKAFVEDAFHSGSEDLETIEYETNRILLQNFPSYYIATVVSGNITIKFREELREKLDDFAVQEKPGKIDEVNDTIQDRISLALKSTIEENDSKNK